MYTICYHIYCPVKAKLTYYRVPGLYTYTWSVGLSYDGQKSTHKTSSPQTK